MKKPSPNHQPTAKAAALAPFKNPSFPEASARPRAESISQTRPTKEGTSATTRWKGGSASTAKAPRQTAKNRRRQPVVAATLCAVETNVLPMEADVTPMDPPDRLLGGELGLVDRDAADSESTHASGIGLQHLD